MRRWPVPVSCAAITLLLCAPFQTPTEDRLAQHRNLGKAFYENPATQKEALEEFRKALALAPDSTREKLNYALALLRAGKTAEGIAELEKLQKADPKVPHTWFNLGVQYKKAGEQDKAIAQFERMIQLVPDEPKSRYHLGALYRLEGRMDDALQQLTKARELDPNLAAAHFQLFNLYRATGRPEEARASLAEFQRLKKLTGGSATPEDVDWSAYSEIYEIIEPSPPPAPGPVRFVASRRPPPAGNGAYVEIDYDHDYDLDRIVLEPVPKLLRNQGSAGFAERTGDFPFVKGDALGAVVFRVVPDTRGIDVVITYRDRPAVLYSDKLLGQFEAKELAIPARAASPQAADLDNDGAIDLLFLAEGTLHVVWNEKGVLGKPLALPLNASTFAIVDLEDRGVSDVVAPGASLRNLGGRRFQDAPPPETANCIALSVTGRDLVCTRGGRRVLLTNASPAKHNWIVVRLTGVRNIPTAPFSEVEVKSGSHYQKKIYTGLPLRFGLGKHTTVDTVRVTWPNGLIQNEPRQMVNRVLAIKEAQRLSGSCPIIWTWNGKQWEYITDVLGVAPLGASSGDGQYFPTDHDEFIQISGRSLKAVNDRYEVRITEELSEAAYLDHVKLIALDHPAGVAIFTNEKFKGPPFPEFRLYGSSLRTYPSEAKDVSGHDVLPKLKAKDSAYPDTFSRDLAGVAALHHLDLNFSQGADGVLVLHGWVDWADGSTFLRLAQEGGVGLRPPSLQMKDRDGRWVTTIEDMGMPAGKPKTIAVDLTGKWLSDSREVRIVTNLCVYWDEIFLTPRDPDPPVRLTTVPQISAELRFRGFSPSIIHPERKQPERFTYEGAMPASLWNPTPGMYTRYGDVAKLARLVDDKLIVMGSGDELRLFFDSRALPPVDAGWIRDFLLLVDGWAKDRDANTAYSQTTEPLPFHAMPAYPYPAGEKYPDTPEYRAYREKYNIRPALRLLRPLYP